ncbi:MAG: acylphosphatase [Acidobacteria bacterium]|jgi:acylphosphatase|nr:acylphosphatase [Acidobacteriota bacterium]MCU0253099.1 acylphosphatase [Acidobacteriota bacterium]
MPARRFTIRGTVQGVGYRSFAKTCADALGVSGWVCNQSDGTVAVHAEGTEDQLAELAFDLSRGPRFARVRAVEPAEAASEATSGFAILRAEPSR